MGVIKKIDESDLEKINAIKNKIVVKDLIYLYKKYLDENAKICGSCLTEVNVAYKRFFYHYDIYKAENEIDK